LNRPPPAPGSGRAAAGRQAWNDPAAQPYVRLADLRKSYGGQVAVDGVSLDIYRGEFFALLGPSGCGKTTLMRCLAGFETPDGGRIEIDGVDMAAVPPYRRPVNMMFQSYALFPHMTVERNIAFGLRQEGVPRAEIAERVAAMLDLVQLGGFAGRKPDQLSGGQQQRVALARALIKRPKLLLLDEPLAALDRKLREETQFELVGIQERLGITFIIVTHDQEEAMTVATRMAVMEHGRIRQVGSPGEIYEYPNSRYVAEFIGDVNIFAGRVVNASRDRVTIQSPDAGCAIQVDHGIDAAPGATVWTAVRPEKFRIATAPPPETAVNCVAGTVYDIGYLGDVSVYHVATAAGRVRATQANRQRLIERPIQWDDKVWLTWEPSAGVVLSQ
jgi:putrescine transport system ATP-binding protein